MGSPLTTELEAGTKNRKRMRSFVLLSMSLTTISAAPQGGLISTLSNLLTSAVGGGNTGEVDGYENAPYNVVNTYDGYEERFYPSKMWVCTRSGRGGFMQLFGYISGDNTGNQKIDMTVPVMMTNDDKGEEMCFYLTNEAQGNPPRPTGAGVYLSRKKSMNVFATTMGGYPNFENEARKLKALLERGRASEVDFSSYMSMSYDNPWKILNRRNDVMYKKL